MQNTRDRILETALKLFASDGYEAVSVSTIAGALGMTKGALYRHFQSKRHIFDSILARMEAQDAQQAQNCQLPEGTRAEMKAAYEGTSIEQIIEFSKLQFRYWTQDSFASAFRRMLTLEQYRSEKMNALYQQYLGSGPLGYVQDLFSCIGLDAPEQRALDFYGPMFLMYTVYDGANEKEQVLQTFDAFMERQRIILTRALHTESEAPVSHT